jgi:quinolinate synthase
VHDRFTIEDVRWAKAQYPKAKLIAHPECRPEVLKSADYVASTSGMIRLARDLSAVILGTEAGMCNRLRWDYPDIECHPLSPDAICSDMKRNTLAKLLWALEREENEISLPEPVIERANQSLRRMLEVTS